MENEVGEAVVNRVDILMQLQFVISFLSIII